MRFRVLPEQVTGPTHHQDMECRLRGSSPVQPPPWTRLIVLEPLHVTMLSIQIPPTSPAEEGGGVRRSFVRQHCDRDLFLFVSQWSNPERSHEDAECWAASHPLAPSLMHCVEVLEKEEGVRVRLVVLAKPLISAGAPLCACEGAAAAGEA